ncbi:C45 family autoproteolytic acyltransferase/hydolase [Noviherbaspirillum saxi]|uniref:Peptidase C45 n=1 Tax=Noviherbaspirillum saxi TaxID=2320863 RepID=A0A3A3FK17_9BURK|nr:C45 family peptidase [Noviherbaspirillum saxi]RJF95051.1 peptidase C45 [Noviherbaspirillum saxi]
MLSHLKIQGSPFDVGAALGRFGAPAMHAYMKNTEAWATVMQWRGSEAVREMGRLVQQRHPQYWQELQGMAAGLEIPFDEVLLWNCRGDVWAMAPDGCTTVQVPGTDHPAFAHNEDGDPGFSGQCAIAEITVEGRRRFASFVYPGSLPGHTFAVSDAGLAMTVNNLRTLHTDFGLPRMVVARAILDLADVASALGYLQSCPRSGGFHLTLGQAGNPDLVSVEFNAALCSVVKLNKPALHANHMIHAAMANQPQIVTGSSGYRQIRGDELLQQSAAQGTALDPLSILFDQGNAKFPIFRDAPDDSDQENTMATASIRIHADSVEWEVYTRKSRVPLFHMINGAQR